ncbi:MAG: response regulator transcription factor [Acidobacteria bacterium]|nr:response regulator transcription factor [Acidobacteriota bacterium]MBI3428085.1 response regulator transcription factor [Acidobacteriota bacterium]
MPTIVLADDHHIVRQGLRALLESEPNFRLVGETGDGLEAVRMVEKLQPQVLITDVMMPGLNGLEVTRQVHKAAPQTRIIILSMHANDAYVVEALKNGAVGYVLKDSQASDLVQAVKEVAAGRRYLSPPLSEREIELYVKKVEHAPDDPYESLTSREREVLQMVAEGRTSAEIADRLFISPRTAEGHRANVLRKLGLQNHTDLVRFALKRGILPMD